MNLYNSSEILDTQSVKISRFKHFQQSKISEFEIADPLEIPLLNLKYKLSLCGRYATKNFYCKICNNGTSIKTSSRKKFHCEIRYCVNPDCLIQRFASRFEEFKQIKRLDKLNKLWHFVIGFESIPLEEFGKDFSSYKKRMEHVLNSYFEKLKKVDINIQAIRVLDFSFVTEGMVFPHYHFAAIPLEKKKVRSTMIIIQQIRKEMIKRMKVKTSFHFQSHGLGSKKGILSYLAIRSSGMYRYDMTKNPKYKHVKVGNLKESIKQEKYVFLKDFVSEKQYLRHFYKKMHFVTIGGLPRPSHHGSNITDDIRSDLMIKCPIHGILERKDIRTEIIFEENHPPPNFHIKTYPELKIEVVRIR